MRVACTEDNSGLFTIYRTAHAYHIRCIACKKRVLIVRQHRQKTLKKQKLTIVTMKLIQRVGLK